MNGLTECVIFPEFLAQQFSGKYFGVVARLELFIVVAGGAAWLYYTNVQEHKRAELSRRLIRPDEIVFTDTVLRQSYGRWRVKGNVTNRSYHELSGFTLKIELQDCPVPDDRCTTIGESGGPT